MKLVSTGKHKLLCAALACIIAGPLLVGGNAHAGDFSAATPFVFSGLFPAAGTRANTIALQLGYSRGAHAIYGYYRVANEGWTVFPAGISSPQRPFWWLEIGRPSVIYYDLFTGQNLDTLVEGELFGNAPPAGLPLTAITRSDGRPCAYFVGDNARIQESCLENGRWLGWELVNQVDNATTSPIALNRSSTTDSLWYGCGTGTQVCEIRLDNVNGLRRYKTSFGAGNFLDGARLTAIVTPSGERFVFGVTINGSTRSRIALRETSAMGSTTQPTYQSYTLGSSTSNTYSSLMPFVRVDGKLVINYFLTSGTSTTKLMQQAWNGSGWDAATQVWDIGQQIPVNGGEPVAYVSQDGEPFVPNGIHRNTIFYRRPEAGGGVKDTIQLEQQPGNGRYVKTQLPNLVDSPELFIEKSDSKLYKIDLANGGTFAQLGTNTWTSTTAMTSDGIGLGYAISNGNLYEITLGDGSRRQIGTRAWSGTTKLVFGYEKPADSNPSVPRLWAIQNGSLLKVDLTNGKATALGGASWTSVTSMAFFVNGKTTQAGDLYIVNANSLYRVNSSTGAGGVIGTSGAWTGATSLAAAKPKPISSPSGLYLFQNNRIMQIDPTTGAIVSQSGTSWAGTTAMTELQGMLYVTKSGILYKVNPSGWGATQLGGSNWPSPVFMTSRW